MRARSLFLSLTSLVLAGSVMPAHAVKTVPVDVMAFQYTPSGRITANPMDPVLGTSFVIPAGNALSAPSVARLDKITFTNRDSVEHWVGDTNGGANDRWPALKVPALGAATLTIPSNIPTGKEYVYFCKNHPGMRGAFKVT